MQLPAHLQQEQKQAPATPARPSCSHQACRSARPSPAFPHRGALTSRHHSRGLTPQLPAVTTLPRPDSLRGLGLTRPNPDKKSTRSPPRKAAAYTTQLPLAASLDSRLQPPHTQVRERSGLRSDKVCPAPPQNRSACVPTRTSCGSRKGKAENACAQRREERDC